MTKILSFEQIKSQQFAEPSVFQEVANHLQHSLTDLYDQNLIQGATIYGSYLDGRQHQLSDIDAVIINDNPTQLLASQVWHQIFDLFHNSKIDFHPVIVSTDDITSTRACFSFMQPLKHTPNRWKIGNDPVESFFTHYSIQDQLRSLTVVISDYNRVFIEPIIYNTSRYTTSTLPQTVELLLSGFKDSYRNLININSIQSQQSINNADLNFDNFQNLFPSLMSPFEYKLLSNLNTFQAEYTRRLPFYTSQNTQISQELEYNNFLDSVTVLAPLVIKFIKQVRSYVLNTEKKLIVS